MNRRHAVAIIGMTLASCAFADSDQFSQIVKPEDFAAAGLSKLSPEELARLNQLVEAYKSGALEAARQQAAAATAAQAAAEARATKAEAAAKTAQAAAEKASQEASVQAAAAKKASGSATSSPGKVVIAPGTVVEFQSVESRIVGNVDGWKEHTIFTLENGQRWQVSDYSHYFNGSAVSNPKVKIVPVEVFGGFRMAIEGIGEMRVRLLGKGAGAAGAQ
jgi:plastocyanin